MVIHKMLRKYLLTKRYNSYIIVFVTKGGKLMNEKASITLQTQRGTLERNQKILDLLKNGESVSHIHGFLINSGWKISWQRVQQFKKRFEKRGLI